ncbi:MAG: helix-turn-helix transcriptional regulator [Lachnospira sp.]
MANAKEQGKNQKLKLVYLMNILYERTDEEHGMTMSEIIDALAEYDVTAERKSIYSDIETLKDYGMDIIKYKEGRNWYYSCASRDFEEAELKLIIDSIQASRFITVKKSNELIEKLEKLASKYQAKKLQRQVYVTDRVKTINEKIYFNVDKIHTAIYKDVKIRFQYFQWNVKKEMVLKHNGAFYEISPCALSWDDENYYLVGYDDSACQLKHFRVDKMLNIEITNDCRTGKDQYAELNWADYSKSVFGMFSGKEQSVRLKCSNDFVGIILDRFGTDVILIPDNDETFVVNLNVVVSPQFIGWVVALGDGVKVIGPDSVVEEMKKAARRLAKLYEV